jgi:hypothetical protein
MDRWSLARRLQDMALRIAADKRIRIGRASVRVRDEVVVEEELATKEGETELEFEIKWPAVPTRASRRKAP